MSERSERTMSTGLVRRPGAERVIGPPFVARTSKVFAKAEAEEP
jgi:hypothetical protein